MTQNLEQGDIVMCTVERIAGTVVFVNIDNNGTGSIILSEIAPGRIRNLRNYVVPKKRIICKVLRISGDHVDLSLRRVTQKEQKELKERYKLEKSYTSILNTVLGQKAPKIINEIKKENTIYELLETAKTDSKELTKLVGKSDADKILKILQTQKQKTYFSKKEFSLTSRDGDGVKKIKKVLGKIKTASIKYISAGKYLIEVKNTDPKKAQNSLKENLAEIENSSKKENLIFSIKEK